MKKYRQNCRRQGVRTARWTLVGAWGLLLTMGSVGFAAEIVREITVRPQGSVPVEESFVRAHISSEVGQALSPEGVARDVRVLLDTRHYTYLGTQVEPMADGVRLVYVAEGRHRLAGAVEVRGNKALSRAKIRELLDLTPGRFVDDQIVASAALKVREEYIRRRFFDATVEGVLKSLPGSDGSAEVQVIVQEGVRTKVPLIRFSGNRALSDARLRKYSGQSPWWNPAGWFSTKRLDPYDLELLRADVRNQYASLGYLDAAISEPTIRKEGAQHRIEFQVTEGERYKIGALSIEGIRLFPEQALLTVAGLKTGDVAMQDAIQSSASAIRDYYGSRGYVDTSVRVGILPDESRNDVVNLHYRVAEGPLAYVRNIWIRGNTRTKDKVIRREITLNPGEIYDEVQANRSERRLANLGYFETVRHYDVEVPEGPQRDIVYEVEEKPTGQFLIGAGFSSVDRIMGFMELSQSNFDLFNWGRFTGGGQKARIGLNASKYNTDVEVSFVEPWFLDQRLQLNLDGFLRNRSFSEYDERRGGGSVGFSRHVPWVGRMGLAYTMQQVRLDDVLEGDFYYIDQPEQIYRFTDEEDRYLQGSLRLNWIYDTRNHPMTPSRGTRATAAATLYGEAVGGDVDMYELSGRIRHYIPTFYGHVVSFYLRTDVIESWGDDLVPIGNRYFLGGGRNVRGFRYRAIGPKVRSVAEDVDSNSYRPVGGQTLVQASAEYTIPITRFFRIAAFYDIGNVWGEPYDVDESEFASSVGGGFRLDFPGFPIRLDYAFPITSDDDYSRQQRWVFWVGFD